MTHLPNHPSPAVTLELGHPTEAPLEDGPQKKRRSARVVIAVRLTLMTESVKGEAIQAEALTVAVNAHGGLLKVHAELLPGQPLTLINAKAGLRETCRTVRTESLPNGEFAVAFEFDRPAPEFWPVSFPPTDWALVPAG
jgi:hypothetical protein